MCGGGGGRGVKKPNCDSNLQGRKLRMERLFLNAFSDELFHWLT